MHAHAHAQRTLITAVVAGFVFVTPSPSTYGTCRITSSSSSVVEQSSQQINRHPSARRAVSAFSHAVRDDRRRAHESRTEVTAPPTIETVQWHRATNAPATLAPAESVMMQFVFDETLDLRSSSHRESRRCWRRPKRQHATRRFSAFAKSIRWLIASSDASQSDTAGRMTRRQLDSSFFRWRFSCLSDNAFSRAPSPIPRRFCSTCVQKMR